MLHFWNDRYAGETFAYGNEPNAFVKTVLNELCKGKFLFAAEGEGRNAVYAATLGHTVYAFDPSEKGREKALKLAANHHVEINYDLKGYQDVDYPAGSFDALFMVFAHMPAHFRRQWHRKLTGFVKPGGKVILEGFSKEQINSPSGGPGNEAMLFSEEELKEDFKICSSLIIENKITQLNEGEFHKGEAAVIRMIAKV